MNVDKKNRIVLTPGQIKLLELFPHHDAKELAACIQDVVAKSAFFVAKEEVNQYGSFLINNLASIVYTMALEYEAMKKE
jgi:Cft2 family RNA processing exonuclease